MVNLLNDIVAYDFLQNALIACVLSGITCGIVGSYIVARRMVFLAGGITHASFGGLGMALWAGFNPVAGALGFAAISSISIEYFSRHSRIREDSAIGIVWSVGMALGALFMSLRPGYQTDLTSYLFGNILLVDRVDIILLAVLTLIVVPLALRYLRPLFYLTFDEDYARSQAIPATVVAYIMAVVIAVTIVLSIKIIGIILLLSLLTIPTVVANALTKDYRRIALIASVVGVLGNLAGFVLSYAYDLPTGSCIIFMLCITLVSVKVLSLPSL